MIPFDKLGWAFHRFGKRIYPREVRQSLCRFLDTLPPKATVLDVGAGTGVLCELSLACRNDLLLTATDPAEGMLRYCSNTVETIVASAEVLPFENNSFDAVMMGEALHHFRDVDAAFLEIVRILKPNGKLLPSILESKLAPFGFETKSEEYGYRYTVHAQMQPR